MRLTIPDDLADVYRAMADRQGRPLDAVITDQLARFQALVPGTRAVVLGDDHLARLAAALALETVESAAQLTTRVERYGAITFESIHLRLTPAQKAELVRRADRQGRPLRVLVKEIVDTLTADFFWGTGAGEPAAKAG